MISGRDGVSKRDLIDTAEHDPFSGWPIRGEEWELGILTPYPHNLGPGYACFISPNLPLGIPLVDVKAAKANNSLAQCPLGFFCPYLNLTNPDTWPVLCPANTYCEKFRVMGNRCMPQGMFEPMACWYGFFCPDPQTIHVCPAGYYCPSGTITPKPCQLFSYCPVGSINEINYGFILLFLGIDLILFSALAIRKAHEYAKQGLSPLSILPCYSRITNKRRRPTLQPFKQAEFSTSNYKVLYRNSGAVTAEQNDASSKKIAATFLPSYRESDTQTYRNSEKGLKHTQRISKVTTTSDEVQEMSTNSMGINSPRIFLMEPSTLDIDYPDDVEVYQEGQSILSDSEELALELSSLVSNVSPLIEAFRLAFNGRESLRMNLEFNKLKYGFGDKIILDSISGEMKAGKMTAILGPSGAGKTSFLNVLMGKVRRTSGEISINGVPAEMHTFRKIIGYVPQDDVMMKELTVREVIHYSARMRLPRDWSNKQVDDLVDAILKVLNLEHVAHALIGDEINRGISGGQRKRVNIGMELAAAPLAICLDEPTSGLDSTAALKVAKILRSISRVGLTVVAIIHQPRIEIFNTFDNVLMIVPGGRTAYFGPVKKAQTYFENSLGFAFPKEANPADVLMDILSGRGKMKNNGPSVRIEAIVKFWETEGHRLIHASKDFCSMEEPDLDAVQTMEAIVKSRGAGFLKQVWSAHQRSLNQQARQLGALAMELFVGMFTGLIMGIAGRADEMYHGVFLGTYLQLSSNPNEWFLGLYGTLVGVAVAMAGGPAGVRLFGEEQVVFWRETASGHSTMAYYLGKNVSAIYRVALSSLHFTGIYIFFSKPTYGFEYQYALVFLNFFCIYGIAVVVSMVVRRENAALLTVVLGLFCAIFDGFAPTLRDARQAYVEFIFDLVPNRWAAEAQYGLSLQVYSHLYNLQYATDYFGYELDKTTRNMCMMVALAIGYRIIGYFLMIFLRRDKQR